MEYVGFLVDNGTDLLRLLLLIRFGRPISASEYQEQFLSEGEGAARAAVKRMSRKIESELIETTINSPDWYVPSRTSRLLPDTRWQGYVIRCKNGKRYSMGR